MLKLGKTGDNDQLEISAIDSRISNNDSRDKVEGFMSYFGKNRTYRLILWRMKNKEKLGVTPRFWLLQPMMWTADSLGKKPWCRERLKAKEKREAEGRWLDGITDSSSHFLLFSLCLSLALSVMYQAKLWCLLGCAQNTLYSFAICSWTWELYLTHHLKSLETFQIPYPMAELLL